MALRGIQEYITRDVNNIAIPVTKRGNTRFYFGHEKPCMDNNYIILDGLEGDTRIYCQRC